MTAESAITTCGDIVSSWGRTSDHPGNAIDREVCQDATCERCGHKGLIYHAFRSDRSYVAVAECPRCRHSFEF